MPKMKINLGTAAAPNWVVMDAKNADSIGGMIPSSAPTGFTAMSRDANGRSQVSTPSSPDDITNKSYVDNALSNAPKGGKKTARFIVGPASAGWTLNDCDYLCDGVNDNNDILLAMNALPSSGGEIFLLDGTYIFGDAVNITKSNVSIVGSGNGTVIKRSWSGSSSFGHQGVFKLSNTSYCSIRKLKIDGNKASYNAAYNDCISLNNSDYNTVQDVVMINSSGSGVYMETSCGKNKITNNTIEGMGYCGIYVTELSSAYNLISGNTITSNAYCGVYITSGTDNLIIGNTTNQHNGPAGIYINSADRSIVVGNSSSGNTGQGYGIYVTGSFSCTISGNVFGNNVTGIWLASASNLLISGNVSYNSSYAGLLMDNCINCNVNGNTIMRGTGLPSNYVSQYSINISGTTNNYNLISNNVIMGKDITNGGGTSNTILNNKFS